MKIKRKNTQYVGVLLFILICISISDSQSQSLNSPENYRPNIIFIAIDDLRPELGTYGSKIAITPNIDAIASQGIQFDNAYCQQAICGPSRASVLTGLRPETSGIIHNYIKIRDTLPEVITLPQYFGSQGYNTSYYGKIFHHGDKDDKLSWNDLEQSSKLENKDKGIKGYVLPENIQIAQEKRKKMFAKYGEVAKYGFAIGPAYEAAEVEDDVYIDGYNTKLAIDKMKIWAEEQNKPFFLALGFNRPHLNWIAPKKYWDMYDVDKIELTDQDFPPLKGAATGLHDSFELRVREGVPETGKFDKELAKKLKHAYLACVSYVDAQIGKVFKAINEVGISDNTIIIIWSDHGFHLGEMGVWGKATNYEIATKVPLILWSKDIAEKNKGHKSDKLIELVDIYPTLCDMAKIPLPEHLDGCSFATLLKNPQQPWKKAAFSQFPTPALREWGAIPLRQGMRETYFGPLINEVENRLKEQFGNLWDKELFENHIMGYAVRTEQYRLIAWKDRRDLNKKPIFIELYDSKNDPAETHNIANLHGDIVNELLLILEEQLRPDKLNRQCFFGKNE